MASPTITTHAAFGSMLPSYWDRLLGDNLNPNLYLYDLGEKRRLPANFGTSIKIPRIKKSTITWSGGTEGAATATCPLSTEYVSGSLVKFRGAVKHSDLVVMTGLSDIVQLSLERIGYDLAKTMDSHIGVTISGNGFSLFGSNAATSQALAATSVLTAKDIARAEVKLEKVDNPRFPGTNKFAAVINPRTKFDVFGQLSGTGGGYGVWVDVNKYNNAEKIFNGEIGSLFGFKFLVSSNQKYKVSNVSAGGATISWSRSYFIAPRAYYVVELTEMNARTYVKQLGSAGAADPTNDFCTVGAKVFFTAIPAAWKGVGGGASASGDSRMVKIVHAVSVN